MNQIDESAMRVLQAAGDGPPFTAALNAAALALTGPDARAFLHGQLANDVNGLPVPGSGRSLLLNHKGHAMAETAVLRTAEGLLCLVDDGKVDWVKATLEQHIVFDDVRLHRPAAGVVSLQGTHSAAVLTAAGLPVPVAGAHALAGSESLAGRLPSEVSLLIYPSRRSAAGGFDLCLVTWPEADVAGVAEPADRIEEARATLLASLANAGAVAAGAAGLAAARVAGRVPTAGGEGGEGVLPQEAGLTHLLSYRKGCYLGQEIMARIEARGNLRRELATLELDALPAVGGDGTVGGQGAGSATGGASTAVAGTRVAGTGVASTGVAGRRLAIELDGKIVGLLGTVARLPGEGVRALAVLRRDVPAEARLSVGGVSARRLMQAAPIMPT